MYNIIYIKKCNVILIISMCIFEQNKCMNETLIKGEKQLFFNQIRGVIEELNDGEEYCNMTLKVGHENSRHINLVMKKAQFDDLTKNHYLGEKVAVRFYISSRKKYDRWYTTASVLDIHKDN